MITNRFLGLFFAIAQLGAQTSSTGWTVRPLDKKNSIIEYAGLAAWQDQVHNAKIKIGATPPPNGGLSVQLVLLDSMQFKNFPFDIFDGPGGYGESHKAYQITLSSSSEKFIFDNHCTAFFEVDPPGGFCFNLFFQGQSRARFSSCLHRVMKENNGIISISIKSPDHHDINIKVSMNGLESYQNYLQ